MDCNAIGISVKCRNGKRIDYILELDNEGVLYVRTGKNIFEKALSIDDIISRFDDGFYDDTIVKAFSWNVKHSDFDDDFSKFIKTINKLNMDDIEYIGLYHDIAFPGERQYQWVKYGFPTGKISKTGAEMEKEPRFYSPKESAPPYMAMIFDNDGRIITKSDGFVIKNGVLEKYKGSGGDVVVPNGVTVISETAFDRCDSITSVVLPEGVTEIKMGISHGAFCECRNLSDVVLPQSLKIIGGYAFKDCRSLTSITLPDGLTSLGHYAFSGCTHLTDITLPESIASIGRGAFFECRSLTDITVPAGVTCIESSTFAACRGLTRIDLPHGMTSIGECAFEGCYDLTGIILPESVTEIADHAFAHTGLTDIVLPDGLNSIEDYSFVGCDSLTDIIIPDGIAKVGEGAFYGCRSLTKIALPDSLKSIGARAFEGCKGLSDFTLPDGVKYIGDNAFKNTVFMDNETSSGDGVLYIGNILLRAKDTVAGSLFIKPGVTSIGNGAFSGCTELTEISLPDSVKSIGEEAFLGCSKLSDITIPNSVTSIGDSAFEGCEGLTNIILSEGLTTIGEKAFYKCSKLSDITIPEGINSIGKRTFDSCHELTSVTLPESLTGIGNQAFYGCGRLADLTMKGDIVILQKDVFGSRLPVNLVPKIASLYTHMDDGALKQYILNKEIWYELDPTLQEEIFLTRQGNTLEKGYASCISPKQAESLGEAVLHRMSCVEPNTIDCSAAAAFMKLFHSSVPEQLLKELYAKLKHCKAGAKAVKAVEKNSALMKNLC